jgi:hypothetical protein
MKNIKYIYELEDILYRPSSNYCLLPNTPITKSNRLTVVEWLFNVHKKFQLKNIVFQLAVTVIDAYVSLVSEKNIITNEDIQGVSLACFMLANDALTLHPQDLSDYTYLTDGAYTDKDLLKYKEQVLVRLDGYVFRPTVVVFLGEYVHEILYDKDPSMPYSDFAKLSYFSSSLMIYKPSLISLAIIYLLTESIEITPDISPICKKLITLLKTIETSKSVDKQIKNTALSIKAHIKKECPAKYEKFKKDGNFDKIIENNLTNNFDNFEKLDQIGEGAFSTVFKARKDEIIYAVKQINSPNDIVEISILKLLHTFDKIFPLNDGMYITSIEGFKMNTTRSKGGSFLFEEFGEFDLKKAVTEKLINYDSDSILSYFDSLLKALRCCEKYDVIHGDVKPENIVWFDSVKGFKLIDFSSSVPFSSFVKLPSIITTISYRAPEIFTSVREEFCTTKIDIWSMGLVFLFLTQIRNTGVPKQFYEIIISRKLNFDANLMELFFGDSGRVLKPRSLEIFNNLFEPDEKYKKFILSMLKVDPDERPNANECLSNIDKYIKMK